MEEIRYGYSPPRQVAEALWEIRGEWSNKFGRRMTIIRLRDGRLLIHSSICLREGDLGWLRSIGTPAFIVAPNRFHCSNAGWMSERFPGAELYVPNSQLAAFRKKGLKAKDVNEEFPRHLEAEILCIPMHGTRVEEAAFVHIPSRTLVLCDLAFNMPDVFTGFERVVMRWNQVGGQFGPSKLTRWLFTKDRSRLVESYRRLLEQPFDRVIVNHGEVLEAGGRELLRSGVVRIFGTWKENNS